jgi:tRNA dimethylallyltransferase
VAGPTAAGKSALALNLALRLGGEIISADSVQVYRGLDIGSAKPSREDQTAATHHLIDVCAPEESMDAGRYADLARRAISDIHRRDRPVLLAGGSGLYLKALLFGLADIPAIAPELRRDLRNEMKIQGPLPLYARLRSLDPDGAARIQARDRQRILRALEVVLQTGRPLSAYQSRHWQKPLYPYLLWAIERPREELKELIARRSREMWRQGLAAEVTALLEQGVNPQAPAFNSLGYRQALAFVSGRMSEDEALSQMIRLTQAYAKRQMTWFKAMPGVKWISAGQDIYQESLNFLQKKDISI